MSQPIIPYICPKCGLDRYFNVEHRCQEKANG